MDRQTLARLREQRAAAYNAMTATIDGADAERGLTAEQQQEYDRQEQEFDRLDGDIKRAERQAERDLSQAPDPEQNDSGNRGESRADRFERVTREVQTGAMTQEAFRGTEEYREAYFRGHIAGFENPPEYRAALNLGLDAEGGLLAPDEFQNRLLEDLTDEGVIRAIVPDSAKFSTSHGRKLDWPHLNTRGAASWVGEVPVEGEAQSEPTFDGPLSLEAWAMMREAIASRDVLTDSVVALEALIRRLVVESFADLENPAFVNGDGLEKPTGFLANIPAANVHVGATGQTTTVGSDDLIEVQHALPIKARRGARWLLADATKKDIRKLKDGDGNYIYVPGLREGESDILLGKPVSIDNDVPAQAASTRSIVYADFGGYWIRDVTDFTAQRLNERFARTRQVGWVFHRRVDGKLMLPDRFAAYENSAT